MDLKKPLISLEHVSKKSSWNQSSQKVILNDISFEVFPGEVISLIGPSGSGKSTCLRCIGGLDTITEGSIRVCGIDYNQKNFPAHLLRRKTTMIFQNFELFPHLTVEDNVSLSLKVVLKIKPKEASDIARELIQKVDLQGYEDKYPKDLSGGQKQRVAIARALALNPEVLLCDEPTSSLDPELVIDVLNILTKLAKSGMTMIVVTHEMNFAAKMSHRCLFMDEGRIIESGNSSDVFRSPQTERLQLFLKSHTSHFSE